MQKLLIIYFILGIFTGSFAQRGLPQKEIHRISDNHVKIREFYRNGKVSKEYEAQEYIVIDTIEVIDAEENSMIRVDTNKTQTKDGQFIFFYGNGNKKVEGVFSGSPEGSVRTGPWNYWYPNGKLKKEENYKRGTNSDTLHGICKEYDPTGKLVKEVHYINNRIVN